MQKIVIVIVLTLCTACSTPLLLVKNVSAVERLGIYFEGGDQSFEVISGQFSRDLDAFILRHNTSPGRKFDLFRASAQDSSTLKIKLVGTRLVTPGQQTTGVVVTALGFTLPIVMLSAGAPFFIGFYYFPQVRSLTELSLSSDLNGPSQPNKNYILSSPGFLVSPEKQIEKHVISFDRLLLALVGQIEKQVAKKRVTGYVVQ